MMQLASFVHYALMDGVKLTLITKLREIASEDAIRLDEYTRPIVFDALLYAFEVLYAHFCASRDIMYRKRDIFMSVVNTRTLQRPQFLQQRCTYPLEGILALYHECDAEANRLYLAEKPIGYVIKNNRNNNNNIFI
jgi:hypothetical protein